MAMFQLFSIPLIVGIVLSQLATPLLALLGLIAAFAGGVWWWRRAPHAGGVLLRVESGELHVLSANGKTLKEHIPLDELDVVLDTKTIQRVQEGGSAIPAMRFIDSKVGPELDTARIVVTGRKGRRMALTDDHVPHMDATEWFGKIRVFLRKNGWVPADEKESERESAPPSSA